MELGAKEIMIALGLLVVIAIVLDVLRRIRAYRYNSIRMPRRKQPIFDDEKPVDEYGSELPSGKARVVAYRDEDDLEQVGQNIKQTVEKTKPKLSSVKDEPAQGSLGLGESQDLFQDLVAAAEQSPNKKSAKRTKPKADSKGQPKKTSQSIDARQEPEKAPAKPAAKSTTQTEVSSKNSADSELAANVIVLHVMSYKDEPFAGDKLKEMLLALGLRFGSMKIFHRHEHDNGAGNVLFSVANSVNPGTFDLNAMEDFSSPGISLFFSMPDVEDPGQVFDIMLTTAQKIASELGGNVSDETRSILTRQMIEHYRQRIAEFARSRLYSRP